MSVYIEQIPAFEDNYFYIAYNKNTNEAIAWDPGDAKPFINFLSKNNLNLIAIFLTHPHWDHKDGLEDLQKHTKAKAYVSHKDQSLFSHLNTQSLKDGDSLDFLSLNFLVLEVPGHTMGHIAFYCKEKKWLFCGDTIFSIGCGRLFEGQPEKMFQSLQKLKQLPDETIIFCSHEYTLDNIRFALSIEKSKDLLSYEDECKKKLADNQPTIPTTMVLEKKLNPFLKAETLETFIKLREKKDNFK